jgi:hypothetical protein
VKIWRKTAGNLTVASHLGWAERKNDDQESLHVTEMSLNQGFDASITKVTSQK